jgi:GAF domain-containing protein/HAMP domain-containing protein
MVFLGQAEVLQSYIKTLEDIADPNIVVRARTVMEREFRRYAENRGIYEQVRFLNNAGDEIIRVETSLDGVSSIVPQSELRKKEDPNSARELSYFAQTNQLSSGEIFESPLELGMDGNQIKIPYEPVIRLGTPLVINTQTKGVILANVYAEKFLNSLSASGSDTFLVDANGYYLFHPDESKRWGREFNTDTTIDKDFPDLVNDLYSGKPGNREVNGYLITYAPIIIPGEDSPRWYIGTFVALDSITRPIFTSTFNSLSLLLLTMSISIFVMTYLSSTITTPLGNLATAAQDIAAGNLSARVNVETKDEVGALAGVFNIMTSQLRELVVGLEARVSERTAELETEKRQSDTRAKQFEAITKVAGTISATQNLQELLPQISKVISEQFGFYHVGIFLNDPTNQMAILGAANSEGGKRMLQRNHQLRIGEQGIVGYVTQTGKPRIALDVGEDANYFNNPELPSTHSEMALPLKAGSQVIGALDIQSTETGAFTDQDFEALSALADQVSLAIQNARLFDQTKKTLAESESIQRQYIRETWSRLPKEEKLSGFRYSVTGAIPLSEETEMIANDGKEDKRKINIPITLRGETIGTLSVHLPKSEHVSTDQIDLIKAVAERVALSAENARLFEETTRRAERERIISDIASKIGTSVRTESILRTTAIELSQLLDDADIFIDLQETNKPKDVNK